MSEDHSPYICFWGPLAPGRTSVLPFWPDNPWGIRKRSAVLFLGAKTDPHLGLRRESSFVGEVKLPLRVTPPRAMCNSPMCNSPLCNSPLCKGASRTGAADFTWAQLDDLKAKCPMPYMNLHVLDLLFPMVKSDHSLGERSRTGLVGVPRFPLTRKPQGLRK